MLNPFPQLLVFSFFAPLVLRASAACMFAFIAQRVMAERKKITAVTIPIIGRTQGWMVWLSVCVTTLTALALFFGYETQWAAIVGMLIALKHFSLTKQFASLRPLSRSTCILLFVICASLLLSGAGAFAMDLPL